MGRFEVAINYETAGDGSVQLFVTKLNSDFSEDHSYRRVLDSSRNNVKIKIDETYIDRIRVDFDGTDEIAIHSVAFYYCGWNIMELDAGDTEAAPDFVWDCTLDTGENGWSLTSTGIDSYVWWDVKDISVSLLPVREKVILSVMGVAVGLAVGVVLWLLFVQLCRLFGYLTRGKKVHRIHFGWKKIVSTLLLAIFVFVADLLVESANWFQKTWDDIEFATVVYQLQSPLKGTSAEIVQKFCGAVIPTVLVKTVLVCCAYVFLMYIMERYHFKCSLNLFHREFLLVTAKRAVVFFWAVVVCFYGICVWDKVTALGIDEYVEDVFSRSNIFEEYYVDPDSVAVTFPDTKRNLIFIYMESMETTYASVEDGGGKTVNYIPELTELANTYVSISNTDKIGGGYSCALTGWTMAGLLSSTSGVPYKIPGDGNSGDQYEKILPGLTTLGDLLWQAGYHNYFLCGSDAEFSGRKTYFTEHGNYEILDYYDAIAKGYIPEDYYVFWGYEDEKLYDIAKTELADIAKQDEPFNFTMLTVDTHHPDGYWCELCTSQYDGTFTNIVACASRQVYDFVSWAQEQDWYENTTIIISGDHDSMKADFWDDIGDYERRTYNCFINLPDDTNTDHVKWRGFTTLDLFPTTLAALGVDIEGDRLGLGTNVFSNEQTLAEQLGIEELDSELSAYSKYYIENFVTE
jgi:phosphoglycerol transferase